MRKKLFLLCLALLTELFSESLTLVKCFEEGLKNNHKLKIVYQKERIANEQLNQAKAPLLPSLNATISQNRYFSSSTTNSSYKNGPSAYSTKSYELKAVQTLFNNVAKVELTKAEINSQINKLEYYSSIQNLLLEVAGSYLNLLSSKDKLNAAQKKFETLEEQLADMQKRFDLGDATLQDLADTESKYYLALSSKNESQYNVDIAKAKLEEITVISLDDYDSIVDIDSFKAKELQIDFTELKNEAFSNNIKLQIQRLNVEYGEKDLKSKKNEYYPKLDLVGSISYYDVDKGITSSENYNTKQNYLGLQLIAPLYQGGATSSKIDEAKEKNIQAFEDLASIQKELEFNIIKEYKGLETIQSQVKSFQIALKSAQTTLDAAKVGYALGVRTHFEILQSIEQLYSIQNSLSDAKYQYKMGELRLKMLVGSLTSEDLVD
jgi:outer membrane protein